MTTATRTVEPAVKHGETYIPARFTKARGWGDVKVDGYSVMVYYDEDALHTMAFFGRATKNSTNYAHRSKEAMDDYIERCIERAKAHAEAVKRRRIERTRPTTLKVGDILSGTWGYEQTNWSFYEVTKVVGKRTVEIRELNQERRENGLWLQGDCRAIPGSYRSDPMTKRVRTDVREDGVSIESYLFATVDNDPKEWKAYTAYA